MTIININKNIVEDIISPIKSLLNGVKEVNKENFAYRINSDRKDELGALCLSFDEMNKGLESKQMMSKMISKTAQVITLEENTNINQKSDCVMVYIGIPEFGSHISNFGEYKTFDQLKTQTTIISGIIMDEGGEIDKIIAEKILAVFRVNNNLTEVISSACKAAKRILNESESGKLPLKVSVGINYGCVISGFLGVGNKRDFTIIGDAVNVAARIENRAEEEKSSCCLISETIAESLNNDYSTETIGEVPLKGKKEPIKIYKLNN